MPAPVWRRKHGKPFPDVRPGRYNRGVRILHLLHTFPPDSRGGTETYVAGLAAEQTGAGHAVWIAAGSARTGIDPFVGERVGGLSVHRLGADLRDPCDLLGRAPRVARALEELCRRLEPDVVHLHHWHQLTSDALFHATRQGAVGPLAGAAGIATLHDLYVTCPLFFRLPDDQHLCTADLPRASCAACLAPRVGRAPAELDALLAEREALFARELDCAASVIAISRAEHEYLAAVRQLRGRRLELLPLPFGGLAAPAHARAPRPPGIRTWIASWGGLVPGKGVHVLVEAVERLEEAESVHIDHHGAILDERYAERLRGLARRSHLRLCGPYAPEELAVRVAGADLAVFPSAFLETHGLVVDEALSLGLPVVVSDRGAPRERIGERGRVFPAGDASALAELLRGLLRDPRALEMLRGGAAEQRIGMAEHARRLEAIYGGARRGRSSGRR